VVKSYYLFGKELSTPAVIEPLALNQQLPWDLVDSSSYFKRVQADKHEAISLRAISQMNSNEQANKNYLLMVMLRHFA
jgi:hypothetical protein